VNAHSSGLQAQLTDRLVYAVGDVHGRADLLEQVLERIRRDRERRAAMHDAPALLVFLGDYIDRGPESRRVIDILCAVANEPEFECRFLIGNHEDAMLDFVDGKIRGQGWSSHGGDATLRSYGVSVPSSSSRESWAEARARLLDVLPQYHLDFLRNLELMIVIGRLVFVHAGIRHGIGLDQQERRDLLWIRKSFLGMPCSEPFLVVHGHTPKEEAYGASGRLCLDTGAYMTGRLTAASFYGDQVEIIDSMMATPRAMPVALPG